MQDLVFSAPVHLVLQRWINSGEGGGRRFTLYCDRQNTFLWKYRAVPKHRSKLWSRDYSTQLHTAFLSASTGGEVGPTSTTNICFYMTLWKKTRRTHVARWRRRQKYVETVWGQRIMAASFRNYAGDVPRSLHLRDSIFFKNSSVFLRNLLTLLFL